MDEVNASIIDPIYSFLHNQKQQFTQEKIKRISIINHNLDQNRNISDTNLNTIISESIFTIATHNIQSLKTGIKSQQIIDDF